MSKKSSMWCFAINDNDTYWEELPVMEGFKSQERNNSYALIQCFVKYCIENIFDNEQVPNKNKLSFNNFQ